ncbi:hypothetical protein [Zavarzinella formosa]|uniref:hypothetical protein n=1 Tax=Zavarzinella formosa TaxID=360055 RepID=UPI0002DA8E38|nr:hypothetical protein [Zavarzinella formosa]
MTFDEANEKAEQKLFGICPLTEEFGWRPYVDRKRQKLTMVTVTIRSEATWKSPFTRPDLRAEEAP